MTNSQLPNVLGANSHVNLKSGEQKRVIMLNNAATTPPFERTLVAVNEFLGTYGAFHRGAGPHANLTYQKTKKAIETIKQFVGLSDSQELLFTANTSAAINLFARLLRLKKGDVLLTSEIEHTSNNLPWSYNTEATVIFVAALPDGSLDQKDFAQKLKKYKGRVKLVAITGASNLSGHIPDIAAISKITHQNGALLFVDAAQLAPHRPINMQRDGIDALAFSAHKVYAPFGIGVLALPRAVLDSTPVDPGGGSIDMISASDVVWAPATSRHQAGTWNVTGIIALAESCRVLLETTWKKIIAHEKELLDYAVAELSKIPGLTLYIAPEKYIEEKRIGTISFNLKGYHHALLSAILENEYAIETRAGTICNHRLVRGWFGITAKEQQKIEEEIRKGNRLASYGIVRASIGIHNTKEDVGALVQAIREIAGRPTYVPVAEEEIFLPVF